MTKFSFKTWEIENFWREKSLEWYMLVCCITILYRWVNAEFNIISECFSWGSFVYAFSAHILVYCMENIFANERNVG